MNCFVSGFIVMVIFDNVEVVNECSFEDIFLVGKEELLKGLFVWE